jgi:GTP-binding protein
MLVDSVEVTLRAGKGGDGKVSWRREKHVPMGGPDGGDGGNGGSVYLVASNNVDTLSSFRYRKVFQAEDGEAGGSKKMHGKNGEDLELLVPTGTVITDLEKNLEIGDLVEVGQRLRIARGGKGGLGNPHFATATHQRPTENTAGLVGDARKIRMELKLIADGAFIGEPNAGKSSLIAAITGVDARIGAYAFSTTAPVLGVLAVGQAKITLIDLPGLLEGAHIGKGLGDTFLKHLQRVRVLLHVVDAASEDVNKSRDVIMGEVKAFNPEFSSLPTLTIFNKTDLLTTDEQKTLQKKYPDAVFTSASEKVGLEQLKEKIVELTT